MKDKEMHAWQLSAEPKGKELHRHHDDGHTLPALLEEPMCRAITQDCSHVSEAPRKIQVCSLCSNAGRCILNSELFRLPSP